MEVLINKRISVVNKTYKDIHKEYVNNLKKLEQLSDALKEAIGNIETINNDLADINAMWSK